MATKQSRDVEKIADDVDSLTLTRMIMTHTKDSDLALLLQSIQVSVAEMSDCVCLYMSIAAIGQLRLVVLGLLFVLSLWVVCIVAGV